MDKQNSANMRPKTMADLLPELTDLLNQESLLLTAKKNSRSAKSSKFGSCTAEKFKPLTIAEMRADLQALKSTTAKKKPQQAMTTSNMKKWNSSIKVDKKFVNHTGDGTTKYNNVRKALDFQQKPQTIINSRTTMLNPETPKFSKPASRAKKSLHITKARSTIRISGVYNITETPFELKNPVRSKFVTNNKEYISNKENMSYLNNIKKLPSATCTGVKKNIVPPPKPQSGRKTVHHQIIPDTPMSNDSWKSSCDASFLQKEKELNDIAETEQAIGKHFVERVTEATPPVSTPFKDYRNVQEFFNNSSAAENSIHEDTIMSFDKPTDNKTIGTIVTEDKKEESGIMSLCDLFTKATTMASLVTTNEVKSKTEIEMLLEVRNEIKNNIQSQFKLLKNVEKLIKKKTGSNSCDTSITADLNLRMTKSEQHSPIISQRCSVIKSTMKSPSYKIPKKNSCLRKKIIYKSMPDMPCEMVTPKVKLDNSDRGITMYMKMKEQMNFLKTPLAKKTSQRLTAKQPPVLVPDTPAVSQNLQMQLGRLFNDS